MVIPKCVSTRTGWFLTVLASGEVVDSEPTGDDSPGTVPDGAHLLRTGPEVTSVACTTRLGHTGAMHRIRLTYFDLPGRGEVARLAMFLGGIDFEDRRVTFAEVADGKTRDPLWGYSRARGRRRGSGATPMESNRFVGKLAGLSPTDPWQAALCDEAMDAVEDIGTQIVATFGIRGKEKLKAKRQSLADGPISFYLARLQRRLKARGGSVLCRQSPDDRRSEGLHVGRASPVWQSGLRSEGVAGSDRTAARRTRRTSGKPSQDSGILRSAPRRVSLIIHSPFRPAFAPVG